MLHLFFFRVVDVVKILSTKKYIYDISYTKMNKKTQTQNFIKTTGFFFFN